MADTRGLSLKDMADTRAHWMELRYRNEPSRVLSDRDWR